MTNNRIYYITNSIQYITSINYELQQQENQLMSKKFVTKKEVSDMINAAIKYIKKIINERIKAYNNSKIGRIFEENIRKTLEIKLKWEISDVPHSFFFRKVYGNFIQGAKIIMKEKSLVFIEEDTGEEYLLCRFNELDKSCEFIDLQSQEVIINVNDKEKNTKIDTLGITVSSVKSIEMDGIFYTKNFKFPNFNSEEVNMIFNNIDENNIKGVINVIVEIKMNKKKIQDLIEQIKCDNRIMRKLLKYDILFIGFVGSEGDLDNKINFDEELQNLKCVIYEIKKDCIFGRNMRQQFDWILIKDVDDIKDEITSIKNSINSLNEKYDEIKNEIKEIKSLLGQKRKREAKKK